MLPAETLERIPLWITRLSRKWGARGEAQGDSGFRGWEASAELARHPAIALSNSACVMRNQSEFDQIEADIDVGVVLGLFGKLGHAVDEGDGLDEGR